MNSVDDIIGTVSGLPKKITDVTENIAKGGDSLDKMMTKLGQAINVSGNGRIRNASTTVRSWGQAAANAMQPLADAAKKAEACLKDLSDCKDVVTTSALVVNATIDSCSGHFHPRNNEKVLSKFDSQWDSWADAVNTSFEKLSPSGQAKILEQLGKNMFGENLYYMGSAIKNNSSDVFGGIADFEDAIHAFRGSYRNPMEAVKKIEKGVKGIVNATERVANSINGMIKTFHNRPGTQAQTSGNPVLSYIGNLHNTKAVAALNKTLTVAGGATALLGDGTSLLGALKSKDPKAIYAAGKKTVDDAKKIWDGLKDKNKATSLSPEGATGGGASTGQGSGSGSGNGSGSTDQSEDGQSDDKEKEEKKEKNVDVGGADSYVCSGATMRCTKGTSQARLTVLPSRTVWLTGQPMANISDHLTMVNLAPFGRCRSLGFPATASATAAHHGHLTPMPCMHNTPFPWQQGKDDYLVKGDPALLKSSTCACLWGGTISLVTDGQHDTGAADLSHKAKEAFEKDQPKKNKAAKGNGSDSSPY